ncbi:sodium- and chloride-dependent glycine transporter 2-like [Lineus longissimus]|uniref:sodium- and chloride-dependent glycine transporter 2-like n=1 Tax=Lineus longissimus TaxID=88925 RepID=UPI002B4F9704
MTDVDKAPPADSGKVVMLGDEGDENKERGNWSGRLDFILSCVGYAVGLGNVWRFPYLTYRNGGGAFLIPYLIMLAFAGLPLFFLELAFGQFASLGCISLWKISPFFKGIGWGMTMISFLVGIYYNVIIAWTLFYFFASFTSQLPWSTCGNDWNTPYCKELTKPICNDSTVAEMNYTVGVDCMNFTGVNMTGMKPTLPSQEYWENFVLGQSDGLENMGQIRWQLALCLLLAWVVIFLCLVKGIKSSGKVVYFTATFPYVVLIILLVRGCTLEGAIEGIKFYVTPDFARLANAKVWADAATQIFYSLGIAFGGLQVMSSYNRFNNNCYRDTLIVAILNCSTSVFAGFVIFSVLGFMATVSNVEVGEVADSGPGLAFVAYPAGIAMMPVAPLWSLLFFFMLFTLGLDSQFAMMETVISAIVDEFRFLRRFKTHVTLGLCISMYLLGLPCVTEGGIYMFTLIDWYSAWFSIMIIAVLESLVVSWVYGFAEFANDIEMMIGFKPNIYWRVCWSFLSPALITFVIIFSAVQYTSPALGNYQYPAWGEALAWLMVMASLIFLPIFMVVECCRGGRFKKVMHVTGWGPAHDWGPALDMHRVGRYKPLNKAAEEPQEFADIKGETNGAYANNGFSL